ncbi:MAG TPA: hypothetical protein PLR65_11065 [Anaerolineales bacterium]|nr:hypothetical protein [Anaerolineales bacterium]
MTAIELSEKQVFVLKVILGTILALNAGDYLALRTDMGFDRTFRLDLVYWFFPLFCFVVMQWILSSEYLHRGWVVAGIIGCATVTPVVAIGYYYVFSDSIYRSYYLIFYFLMGVFATAPQGILLRNKDGLLWVLANGVGWVLVTLYFNTRIHLLQPIPSLPILQTFIYHTYYLPLGILVGLSLYNIKVKSSRLESNEMTENKQQE